MPSSLRRPAVLAATTLIVGVGISVPSGRPFAEAPLSARRAEDRALLAFRWAPIHKQEVDDKGAHGLAGRGDYITRVDFDGDFVATNNWDNAGRFPLPAHAYYAVVETPSHWFITYMFFHPRDWTRAVLDAEHENDAEGVMLAIARRGGRFGTLQAAITVSHYDFHSYTPRAEPTPGGAGGRFRAGAPVTGAAARIVGAVNFADWNGQPHPLTAQEGQGHELRMRQDGEDTAAGITYFPSLTAAEEPRDPRDDHVLYRLLDIFAPGGLWDRRDDPHLFAAPGTFAGDESADCGQFPFTCRVNAANSPWGWDDQDDGPIARGDIARDPARLFASYFAGTGDVMRSYTFNPYRDLEAQPVASNRFDRWGRLWRPRANR